MVRVFFDCFLPYSLKWGLSIKSRACRYKYLGIPLCLLSTRIRGNPWTHLKFVWILGIWTLVLTLVQQELYPLSNPPVSLKNHTSWMWWSTTFWFFKGQEARTLIRMLYKCNPEYPHHPHPCLSHWQRIHETRSAKTPGTKARFPILSNLAVPSGQLVQHSPSAMSVLLPLIALTSHAFPCTSPEPLKIDWILLRLFLIIIQFPGPNIFYPSLLHLSLSFQVFLSRTPSMWPHLCTL